MCGLFFKRSLKQCPNCGAGLYVDAGILADDHKYRCGSCGAMLFIKMRFGRIESVSCTSPVSEVHKGYGGESTSIPEQKQSYTGNDAYWKEHYGNDWKNAHDEWEREDDEWWKSQRR